MDMTKQPGIIFRHVYLTKLHYSLSGSEPPKEFKHALRIDVSKEIQERKEGGKRLLLTLSADPMFGVEPKPFEMQVELLGIFDAEPNSNLPIETFADVQAPAQLVPYLREVISNITARTPLRTLILPPINVHAFLAAKKQEPSNPPGKPSSI